jgi:hypothetical protein
MSGYLRIPYIASHKKNKTKQMKLLFFCCCEKRRAYAEKDKIICGKYRYEIMPRVSLHVNLA